MRLRKGYENAEFEIAIDSTFIDLWKDSTLQSVANKRLLLSLLNAFEEDCWRMEKFRNLVWDNIAETALSHRARAALSGQPPLYSDESPNRAAFEGLFVARRRKCALPDSRARERRCSFRLTDGTVGCFCLNRHAVHS